jgi:hypothetical protein
VDWNVGRISEHDIFTDISHATTMSVAEKADARLIDNREDLVAAWRGAGGSGYCFRSDKTFAADAPGLLG